MRPLPVSAWLVGGLLAVAGCAATRDRDAMAPGRPPASPHVEMEGVRLADGTGDHKLWELSADRIVYRTRERDADLQGVEARFYEHGRLVSRGKAPAAVLAADAHHFTLAGGVGLHTPDGRAGIEARGAKWEPASGKLQATGPVRFWRPIGQVEGGALVADRDLARVVVTGGVHGRLRLPADGTFPSAASSKVMAPARGSHR